MKSKCKHCGCTETNACYHPDFGTCWWINDKQDECSHCIELKDFPGVVKPSMRNVKNFEVVSTSGTIEHGTGMSFFNQMVKESLNQGNNTIIIDIGKSYKDSNTKKS